MLISPSGRGGTSRWHSDVSTSITPIDVHHLVDLDFFGGGGPEGSPEEEGRSCFTGLWQTPAMGRHFLNNETP